jgi:hypothetical protein
MIQNNDVLQIQLLLWQQLDQFINQSSMKKDDCKIIPISKSKENETIL